MGRWNEMKEPESLEDYAARLVQQDEPQPMGLSAGGGPLRIAQPLAAHGAAGVSAGVDTSAMPRPTPRPTQRSDSWVPLTQPETVEYGVGYYTYGTDETYRPGTKANGQYGDPRAMQVITSVAGQLANGPVKTPFGVGNISLRDGRRFPPHGGHRDGLGIDIRPPRLDKKEAPVDFRHPQYDLAGTQLMVDALHAAGVKTIYFNGPGIKGVTPDRPGVRTHDNHLHAEVEPWRGGR